MKQILLTTILITILLPLKLGAQGLVEVGQLAATKNSGGMFGNASFQEIVTKLIVKTSNYIITFLFALTLLVFMFGLMKFMFKGSSSDTARSEGRKLMLWGVIGIFVIVSVWSLVGILSATIGHNKKGIPQFSITTGDFLYRG